MVKLIYTVEKLNNYVSENKVTLIGEYEKTNRDTKISGQCLATDCPNTFCKTFCMLIENGGAYCFHHAKINGGIRGRAKQFKENLEKLLKFAQENNITLYGEYVNVNTESRITGLCTECEDTNFDRSFTQFFKIGGLCGDCTKENMTKNYKEKTGYDHPSRNPEVHQKKINTYKEKTGYEYAGQNPKVIEEMKKTCLERYGFEYAAQNPKVIEEMRKTCLERYGFEYAAQNSEVLEQMKKTCLERYGFEYPMQNPEVQREARKTCLERYGFEYAMQNPEVSERSSKNAYKAYDYKCPSGEIRRLQGYEKFGMKRLLKKYDEDDIVNSRTEVPELYWKDEDDVWHRHFVDFFVPLKNLCVEVKSTWTFKCNEEEVLLKQKYAKKFGFKYEIWVFDKNGELEEQLF